MRAGALRRPLKLSWLVWLVLPALVWWLARDIPVADWRELLRSIHLSELGALVALNVLAVFIFSTRWWLALVALGYRIPFLAMVQYRLAAFSISYFTPGTQFGGEPLQIYALEKHHRLPRSAALASIAVEKLFELLANFTFLAFGLALIVQNSWISGSAPLLAAICALVLTSLPAAYLLALARDHRPLAALFARLPARLRSRPAFIKAGRLLQDTEVQVVGLLRCKPGAVLALFAVSLLIWIVSLAEYWLALYVLGAALTLPQTIIALTAARLAFLTPLPAGLGALEAGQMLALQAVGFGPVVGITISLWIRLRDLILASTGLLFGALLVHSEPTYTLSPETGD
jgi:glycosyltransferase 2 family protein